MTVADLIRDLQAMPNQSAPVQMVMSCVWAAVPMGWEQQDLSDEDALEADEVRYMGAFVLIRSK